MCWRPHHTKSCWSWAPERCRGTSSKVIWRCANTSPSSSGEGTPQRRRHLDLVGSFRPAMREADDDCLEGALIAVDTLAALHESGDLIGPLARSIVAREDISLLGALIATKTAAPRPPRTVFKS